MKMHVQSFQCLQIVTLLCALIFPVSCEEKDQLADQSIGKVAGPGPYEKIHNLRGTVILKP
ncbi:MAG: hypothetical protein NZ842_03830, partial [Dehalococcoidia bacterium]|nr:hypothetical protein [Dehalococcoidia bacterium]